MARCARLISFDLPMHIMSRGNNRHPLFANENEKSYFRHLLRSKKADRGIHIYHYCLMNTHIHLIVRLEPGADLSKFLKQVFLAYYSFFRNEHDYSGHLFQGRFKNLIIDSEGYLIRCGKYIELNPVRARMVSHPSEYEYSSFSYYAEGLFDPLVTPDPYYESLGRSDALRQKAYRAMFIDHGMINSDKLRKQLYLGSDTFITAMEQLFGIKNIAAKRGRPFMNQE